MPSSSPEVVNLCTQTQNTDTTSATRTTTSTLQSDGPPRSSPPGLTSPDASNQDGMTDDDAFLFGVSVSQPDKPMAEMISPPVADQAPNNGPNNMDHSGDDGGTQHISRKRRKFAATLQFSQV